MRRSLDNLVRLAQKLMGPDGCPWDKAQTPESLSPYLVEEASEAAQAIQEEGPEAVREELGDLLYLIVFISHLYQEKGEFDLDRVADAVEAKMIHRHPHIFGPDELNTAQAVKDNWDRIKRREKDPEVSLLDSVPRSLPGLLRTHRLSQRASTVGFDWDSPNQVLAKVEEELAELKQALNSEDDGADPVEELGDLFFALANLSRHLGLNPETVVHQADRKFISRFKELERVFRERGRPLDQAGAREMDQVWEEVKKRLG